ncbi:MAG: outer membrane protein assembly factor BamA [Nitrospirae bacterium CG_4_10_14_0_8_um_filter_41_23]|nr:MAG: outer membrane protein assembly factor BamA [Nitrospirae bacterium CG11_big_fil_rev_8_21_14_0_20_41_14]PIV43243.1 MAG: outer membrane protein assembly factor BamA [Nitrospirae bacterium CG02_land_8_20_14_3_00_41_53]PIW87626.1 MAG: outer membrane protein assembly factor BamA [Nitrospirae bacterium CG_4_8_14_3_um_filter_41_47]PIY86112.1 MAG: outer membrane protein assembly factor BamA [Nitrospirae bacterium CG_4_10_14_0_8_um_filter_41_23]PJA79052.1 MAG: outer membrane protein assembly fac
MFFTSEAAGSVVGEIEINGLYSISKDEFLYILDINPGKQINEESVRLGIKRAFLKGMFEDISVETIDGERAKVIINVKERNFIKNIYVEGDYPLSRKTIKKLFPLKEDQVLICDVLEKAMVDLRHELALRGFPHAGVNAEIKKLKEPYRVNIHLQISAGDPERIREVNISGAGDEVKAVMKLSDGDIYDRLILKKDIERIKAYYKNKKYFKPVIGPYTYTDGILHISVNPGKRLQISIEGNNAVPTNALLKEIPFFEAEEFSDDIIEEAVHKMLSLYHRGGHPFAQIAPVITSSDDVISLNFFIFEGVKVSIRTIKFSGISLPEKNLKEIMSLKEGGIYNPDIIGTDRETLKDFYNALGYLTANIEEFQTNPPFPPLVKEVGIDSYRGEGGLPNKIDIIVRINEGLKTEIERVNVIGTNLVPEAEVRKAINIKPGDVYNDFDISDARFRVIDLYNTYGLTEAVVSIKREGIGQKTSLTFQIDEGAETLFGKTIIVGNNNTKYAVVRRELQQKEDTPFNYRILTKERQKLYKLDLFTDVDMEVLDRYDHKKDVLIKLREGNAGAVELSFGYAEYEGFRGIFDLSYRNLWGMNRQGSLRFELSSLEKRYILQYSEPWFLGIPLQFRAFLLSEDKKEINIDTRETRYRLIRHTATAGFEKKIGDSLKSELYYEFSLVNTFDVKPDVILSREDTGALVISGIRLGIIYDTRDNPFYPEKGILSGISVKLTSPVFLSETSFIKLMFYGNAYQELIKGVVFAISLRGGIAQGYLKTDELPIVERFFLGGRTTVRGYEQDTLGPKGSDGNPTGGNVFLMENLEIRTSLGKGIGIVAFLDGGNVWVKIKDINSTDIKFTTGLGLRYNTPVGPIRIDYGQKLQRKPGESRGEIHFSIGHAF